LEIDRFFNTVGKLIEAAATKRLRDATEMHILFPDFQIGARSNRSTEIVFEFLTEQIHIA
jgi:hypothetical protein